MANPKNEDYRKEVFGPLSENPKRMSLTLKGKGKRKLLLAKNARDAFCVNCSYKTPLTIPFHL
jgi:hypothetical protein